MVVTLSAQPPTLQALIGRGIRVKRVPGLEDYRAIMESSNATIRLPYADEFQMGVAEGSLDLRDEVVTSLWLRTKRLGHDDVYAKAAALHETLGIDAGGLNAWMVQARANPLGVKWYEKANDERWPRSLVAIRRSYNPQQPWVLYLHFDWLE